MKNQTLEIYIELGGEDSKKRQRSKKLIKEIYKNKKPNFENIKIILSGKAGFNYKPKTTEAKDMKKYITKNSNIPNEIFILEEKSMDTLGNLYFSSKKIINIINKIDKQKYNKIQIHIITQEFHIHRTKHFFEKLFHNLKFKIPIKYNFISANSRFKKFFHKLYLEEINFLIEKAIDFDFLKFKIKTFQDYENYLFSLPIYGNHYKAKHQLNGSSAYETLIEKHTQKN